MQSLNAYGLACEHVRDAIQPTLAGDLSAALSWEAMGNAIQTQERLLSKLRHYFNLPSQLAALNIRAVDLGAIARQIKGQHEANFSRVLLNIHGFENCWVMADQNRLLELLSCLAENAAAHAKTAVCLAAQATREGVCIEIVDDGSGLATGVVELLGMPFIRLQSRAASTHRGLGLGIYIATRNAELLHAALDVSSTPGVGCRFSITLPLADTPSLPADSKDEADPLAGARILVVDSDEQRSRALLQLLASWKCQPDLVHEWSPSLARVAQEGGSYDVLFLSENSSFKYIPSFKLAKNSGSKPSLEIFVMAERRQIAAPDVVSDPLIPGLHVLHPPLTPSRLRSALSNALRIRASSPHDSC
ncbi:histidine kinase/DNA gyrase B/HSP90-like ATPase [Azonexus fungiphilus]|uniref:histidine kinase n=1 Tax=Azonexus fungiphilus TaxID=146940 RepID=A0A495WQV4_9RHOO|nr:sensor histidine kinase [Azonexus fungiphilus]RKT62943.1 histidine kinase/DNA gyrase B/HSP90-like ATPase [Azonexus fungiphilus]